MASGGTFSPASWRTERNGSVAAISMVIQWDFDGDLMGFSGDSMGFSGDSMVKTVIN